MKNTVRQTVRFLAFFVAFYALILLLIASSTALTFSIEKLFFKNVQFASTNHLRIRDLKEWLSNDANHQPAGLALGSSSVCLNVNPYILTDRTGIDFFIGSNDGQPLSNSLIIFEHCLRSGRKIDYLLLGIDHMVWDKNSEGASLDWMVKDPDPYQWHLLKMALDAHTANAAMTYAYMLVKRMLPFAKYSSPPMPDYTRYIGKGYKCSASSRMKLSFEPTLGNTTISSNNLEAFFDIVRLCRERNVKLILLRPKLINYNGNAKLPGAENIPMIDAIYSPVDTGLYYDNFHMYCEGGTVYSNWLAREINERSGRN